MAAMAENWEKFGEAFRALVPINGLSTEYQEQVLAQGSILSFSKGQHVFREGDRDAYTYYLLEGELRLSARGQHVKTVVGGTDDALHPLAQLQPRQLSASVVRKSTVLRVDRNLLDKLMALEGAVEQQASVEVVELDAGGDADWMTRMLQSELFSRVPAANIQRIFTKMECLETHAGDEVVKQGGPGDYYYVVQSGRCEVVRTTTSGQQRIRLAELGPGDSFGEEALVANSHRNASVVMLTDGELRRLTKDDFIELIKNPLLNEVDFQKAEQLHKSGATWLDVRFPDEFKKASLADAINIPLNVLRLQSDRLTDSQAFIACCDSGTRSAVAAFLLAERGFDVYYLVGGFAAYGLLTELPQQEHEAAQDMAEERPNADAGPRNGAEVVPFPPDTKRYGPAPARGTAVTAADSGGASPAGGRAQPITANDATLEADVKAQALKAELAKATLQLEEAQRLKEEAETARRIAEEAAEQRIRTERDRLLEEAKKEEIRTRQIKEQARLAIESERARLAEQQAKAEQAAQAAKADAERRIKAAHDQLAEEVRKAEQERQASEAAARAALEQERKRLSDESLRITAERSAAEQAAEEKLKAERARLEQEAEQARRIWEDAQKLKLELEQARQEAEQESQRRHAEQEDRIRVMQEEAEVRLREEERRLEQTYAWQAEELAKLQKLKEDAEAKLDEERGRVAEQSEQAMKRLSEARRIQREVEAAKDEASREAETRHQRQLELERRLRNEIKEKIKEERVRLEAEFARNAEELERARRERDAAEAARTAAAEEAEKIIHEYKESHEQLRRQEEATLAAERQRLESEARKLKQALLEAQSVKNNAVAAQQKSERELANLKRQQLDTAVKRGEPARKLASDIATVERNVVQARARVVAADHAQQLAQAAQRANTVSIERNTEATESARIKMEQEINEWLHEQDQADRTPVQQQILANQREHLERIKRRAQQARDLSKVHDQTLIDELERQLRD